jgi:AcrR family transcriptional regulator
MAPRQVNRETADDGAVPSGPIADRDPESAVRRAPFSDNPEVGARGQRTQQRILDAALQVFGERGYHQTGIAGITEVAGCSRASFYQYFSSKEDVYRRLTGQVARQISASTEALRPLTPDVDGWRAMREWVGRYADTYARYEPVFATFWAAAETDEAVAPGAARTTERNIARLRSKLPTTALPPRKLDPLLQLVLECLARTLETVWVLRSVAPAAYPLEQVEDALTDVFHRSLFGAQADVNVRPHAGSSPPHIGFGPVVREALQDDDANPGLTAAGRRTLAALLEAGHAVFVERGYHPTRVDDIVATAGVSHGAFYRYFKDKHHLAEVLGVRAIRDVSVTLADIPDVIDTGAAGRAALRRWLRRYNATQANQAAMITVWVDAGRDDPDHERDAAAALDWGRRTLARYLEPRQFGDVDTEAVVMEALLSGFGSRERPPEMIDAAAHVIERGLLGL